MTINFKVWDFPKIPIQQQVFHVPGAAFDGGLTSGGARINSPEPGGRAVLETTIAFQVSEWSIPFSSWIMSKTNGQIFRIQLTKTPQLASLIGENNYPIAPINDSSGLGLPWGAEGAIPENQWDNLKNWDDDGFYLSTTIASNEGSVCIELDVESYGEFLKHGHVIGAGNYSYIIDDIEYTDNIAKIYITPPLRNDIKIGDSIYLKPYFTGSIANGPEIRNTYEASNIGAIQLNRIIFNEVVL